MKPAIGTRISVLPTNFATANGACSPSLSTLTLSNFAMACKSAVCFSSIFCSSAGILRNNRSSPLLGAMLLSARMLRTATITSLSQLISVSASVSKAFSSTCGKGCNIMLSAVIPIKPFTFCQISSVINGMSGCAKRNNFSNT